MSDATGAYLHIPFCARRCDYCAFATWTDRPHLIGDYLAAIQALEAANELSPSPALAFSIASPALMQFLASPEAQEKIMALKASVPVWKRQVFDDGEQEWVGTP